MKVWFSMNTNRYETPRARTVTRPATSTVGAGWWAAAIGSTIFFVVAIWLLTHST
jgi:hypothetical protein